MDDLDNFFGDEAAEAFVNGLNFNIDSEEIGGGILNTEGKEAQDEFIQALLNDDDLLFSSLLGDNYEFEIKQGKYSKLTKPQSVDIFFNSSLADQFYPKDRELLIGYIMTHHSKQEQFDHKDLMEIARQMVILNLDQNIVSTTQQLQQQKQSNPDEEFQIKT